MEDTNISAIYPNIDKLNLESDFALKRASLILPTLSKTALLKFILEYMVLFHKLKQESKTLIAIVKQQQKSVNTCKTLLNLSEQELEMFFAKQNNLNKVE